MNLSYKEYLDNKIEKYFVIEQDDKIIGAGGINFSSDMKIGKISWDFIQVDYHGKGLGKQLLDHRIQLLKSINTLEQITVRTSQFAYKFYEKQGFKLLEIKKDFWANEIDLYFMKLE